jgi:hypothetical protein
MRCDNFMCDRQANGVVRARKQYCSDSCVPQDSSHHSLNTRSRDEEPFTTAVHGGQSEESSHDEKETTPETQNANNKSEYTQKRLTRGTQSKTMNDQKEMQSFEELEIHRDSNGKRMNVELQAAPHVKYLEQSDSSGPAKSASMIMINGSIEQLNSIKKDLIQDYNGRKLADGQAIINDRSIETIRTICMVNAQILSTMKIGVDLIKLNKEK